MSLRPHWTRDLAKWRRSLARHSPLLIASDFDGTLSPLVDHPADASLHPTASTALERLAAQHPRVRLAFVSGRSLADLSGRIPVIHEGIILGGNHGLELRGAGLDWIHPDCRSIRPSLNILANSLLELAQQFDGVELEDKGASLSLHYRRMAISDLPRLHAAIALKELAHGVRRHDGKCVVEFRPRVDWHKGYALRRVQQHFGIPPAATVFLGDDVTDEDAFRELNGNGVTLNIGPESAASLAGLHARDPADAARFLSDLASWLECSRSDKPVLPNKPEEDHCHNGGG